MNNKGFPVVIPYISVDNGRELKHALRSLKNITNFSGEVFIIGDKESWFNDKITHIPVKRISCQPYYDQVNKMVGAIYNLPQYFIASQDDIYYTQPVEVSVYNQGIMKDEQTSMHKRTKKFTADVLRIHGCKDPLDFELHYPMLVNRVLLYHVLAFIRNHPKRQMLQWRSLYGNWCVLDSISAQDNKTRNMQLKDGAIISTNCYTKELEKLFPEPSIYETI